MVHCHDIIPAPGVGIVVDRAQALTADMSVPLRRRQVGMAEQLLHNSQVGASVEEVGGVGVAQRVGVCRRRAAAVEQTPHVAGSEGFPALVDEHSVDLRASRDHAQTPPVDPTSERIDRRLAEGHHAALGALAEHGDTVPVEVEVGLGEREQLANAQPAAVEQLQHRVVAGTPRRILVGADSRLIEELRQLIGTQHPRQAPAAASHRDPCRRIGRNQAAASGPGEVPPEG